MNPMPPERKPTDLLYYIYTRFFSNNPCNLPPSSGTTGLPKASLIKHLRCYLSGMAFSEAFEVQTEDRLYNTLPLYHSAGGMIVVATVWYRSATMVLRRK